MRVISMEEEHDEAEAKSVEPIVEDIWVNEFNEEKARLFGAAVMKAAREDKKRPIIIYIDSYGGQVDALMNMISVMDSVPNKKITVCTGKAMSCGADLLSHGDMRFVSPHSRVMIHEMSAAAWGNINDLKTDAKEMERLNAYIMELLAKNCGYSLKDLKKMFGNEKREIYLSAKQAVKFGIADKIGVPKLKKISKYEIVF